MLSTKNLKSLDLTRQCIKRHKIIGLALLTVLCSSCTPLASRQSDQIALPDANNAYRLEIDSPMLISSDGNSIPITPWIQNIRPTFERARGLVENELQVDLSKVKLLVVSNPSIDSEVSHETKRLVQAQFGQSAFARSFLEKIMDVQSGTYAALYSSRLNTVMVSQEMLSIYQQSLPDDPEIQAAALLSLLIHELVHAADDSRFNIHENRALNFRASFAQSATFEGHAQWVTRNICYQHQCESGLSALDRFMFNRNTQETHSPQSVEAISHNVLEYSYIEGERFISALAKRPNGQKLIKKALKNPPYDPIQILSPESFPNTARENINKALILASLDIDHPWVQGDWVGVESSPLKGINLRNDPSKRQAAVDGFTRLIEGMVALQLYNRQDPSINPIEVTSFKAESAYTASLFARTLHQNTQVFGAVSEDEPLQVRTGAGTQTSTMKAHIYRSLVPGSEPFRTTTLLSGPYVVQIAGHTNASQALDDYVIRSMLNLQLSGIKGLQ